MFKILKFPLSILNWFIPKVNIHLSIGRKTYFKKNVFNTNFNNRALVSYLSAPFAGGPQNKHTNHLECLFATKTLSEMGYNVDVIDFDHHKRIDYKQYDVIYGFGNQFEQSFYDSSFIGKRIVYSPGCNTVYSNLVSCLRLKDYMRNGGSLNPNLLRTTGEAWPLQKYLSDAVICLGNEFVLNTYKQDYDQTSYYRINCFPLELKEDIGLIKKDFSTAKYNLLWFGSQGSVHKGLDLVLRLIDQHPNLKLYIRGLSLKHEHDIINQFQYLIAQNRLDIKPFVDINSKEFNELMQTCGAVIFPSASEGGAAALLTVMKHGSLIPIITKACGLDIDDISFVANETSFDAIGNQLNRYLKTKDTELEELSKRIRQEVTEHYSQELYQNHLKKILNNIMQS
jgi:glycosyltransferase involved in cell wall biosynthesis